VFIPSQGPHSGTLFGGGKHTKRPVLSASQVVPSDGQPAFVTGLHSSPKVVPEPPPPLLTLPPPAPAPTPPRGRYPTPLSTPTKHASGAAITTLTTATNFQEAFAIIVVAPGWGLVPRSRRIRSRARSM
jgi:hypothetical protein